MFKGISILLDSYFESQIVGRLWLAILLCDMHGSSATKDGPRVQSQAAARPLNTVLPPLILGTATFNTQYVEDPLSMPYQRIVSRAISLGVNAFDTSPYYGPSELLLGTALAALTDPVPTADNPSPPRLNRDSYFLITKAGRIAGDEFDYSPAYIRYSVLRSLQRLRTPHLDLVYTHDVEFVSPAEVLAAVLELRRLRDEDGIVRYVGISGYPVGVLCELAEMIHRETGEGLDAVLSYGHFTVQNRSLGMPQIEGVWDDATSPLARFKASGVGVVLNASMLGMGLLTSSGIPPDPETPLANGPATMTSPLAKWHPSPSALRIACKNLAELASSVGERLEAVAIRWSLEEFARVGAEADVSVYMNIPNSPAAKIGASVMGVSSVAELEDTVAEWRGVLDGMASSLANRHDGGEGYGKARQKKILDLVRDKMWPALGLWKDYSWASPGPGFVNSRKEEERGTVPSDDGIISSYEQAKGPARL